MRTPFKASRRVAAPLLLATSTLSLFALHCSTNDGTQPVATPVPTAGAGGGVSQGGSSSGTSGGGVTTTAGTSSTAGTVGTIGNAGTAGAIGASGSSSGGAGGTAGAAGSGGGGNGSPLFAAVKTLMAKSCGVGTCHNAASGELDFQAMDGMLYQRLTQPVPAGGKHCVGSKAIVANDANSLLLQAIKAKGAVCMKAGGGTEMIGQMPDNCPTKEGIECLTAAEQKIFSDWVLAGAPM